MAVAGRGQDAAIRQTLALAQHAEALGYDRFWVSEHHSHPSIVGTAPEVLIDAIRLVARGKRFIDPGIAQRMAMQDLSGEADPLAVLSPREFEVFVQLARGQSVVAVAETLSLSVSTVGTHVHKIKQKLDVSNTSEITLLALRLGLIDASGLGG